MTLPLGDKIEKYTVFHYIFGFLLYVTYLFKILKHFIIYVKGNETA